jgi:hypothetical protein
MARHEVNPIEDWESEELSEEELDLLAGGFFDPFKPIDLKFPDPDPTKVEAKTDSSYSSFLGANGTNQNEASLPFRQNHAMPLNLTDKFP